jgi:hypothetical protein
MPEGRVYVLPNKNMAHRNVSPGNVKIAQVLFSKSCHIARTERNELDVF